MWVMVYNQKFNYVRFSSPEQRSSAHGSAGVGAADEHVHPQEPQLHAPVNLLIRADRQYQP